jgi:hypothetical protein
LEALGLVTAPASLNTSDMPKAKPYIQSIFAEDLVAAVETGVLMDTRNEGYYTLNGWGEI